MYDAPAVEVLDTKYNFTQVLLRPILWKAPKNLNQRGTITAVEIFHNQVEIIFTRERPIKLRHKITFSLPHHDCSFRLDIGDLILGHHVCLLKHLNRKVITS